MPKAYVTGICKKFTFGAGEPMGPVYYADPISGRQVLQPPVNVPMGLLIQLDSVMEMVSFHRCFNHAAKKGPIRSAYMANKVKLACQQ